MNDEESLGSLALGEGGEANPVLHQRHFRFRTDAALADAAPAWSDGEDSNYKVGAQNFRVRIGVANYDSAPVAASDWQLYASKNNGAYAPVTVASSNVRSADAGASADEAAIEVQRLTSGT